MFRPKSGPRRSRALSLLTVGALTLGVAAPASAAVPAAAPVGASAAALVAAAAPVAAEPKPIVLPEAQSWVGGKQLIGTGVLTDLPAGVKPPKSPEAASWLVADLDARTVLAGRRVHVPLAPASTLKIFTALALAPELDPKTVYTGQDADAAIDGTKVGIVPGSKYTVDDLLHGMLMSSGNDAANAIGTLAGGTATATGKMQDEALELGAFDTVPRTTSGLDAKGQVSSAYDLALAGSAALAVPQLAKIMKTTAYKFPGKGKSLGKKRTRFEIQNHNRLLRNYQGSLGVKNGYTIAARGSFVGAATRNGHTYLAVVMRAEGSTWHETADLLDWAFRNGTRARPVGTLVAPGELPAMIGPALGDEVAAAGTPAPTVSSTPTDDTLRGALPAAASTLSAPAAGTPIGKLALAAAALMLVALAFFVGRRRLSTGHGGSGRYGGSGRSGRGGRSAGSDRAGGGRPRSGPRIRLPGSGRHRS